MIEIVLQGYGKFTDVFGHVRKGFGNVWNSLETFLEISENLGEIMVMSSKVFGNILENLPEIFGVLR